MGSYIDHSEANNQCTAWRPTNIVVLLEHIHNLWDSNSDSFRNFHKRGLKGEGDKICLSMREVVCERTTQSFSMSDIFL